MQQPPVLKGFSVLSGSERHWSWQWDETGAFIQEGEQRAWLEGKEVCVTGADGSSACLLLFCPCRRSKGEMQHSQKGQERVTRHNACEIRCLVMECWGEPRKLGLYRLLCCLPAVGSEAGMLGSVSSVFRGKKGSILTLFLQNTLRSRTVECAVPEMSVITKLRPQRCDLF